VVGRHVGRQDREDEGRGAQCDQQHDPGQRVGVPAPPAKANGKSPAAQITTEAGLWTRIW
jgi:hypothetical protein